MHRHYYRLPDATIECTKVASIIMSIMDGTMNDNKGLKIDQIMEKYVPMDNDQDSDSSDEEEEEESENTTR